MTVFKNFSLATILLLLMAPGLIAQEGGCAGKSDAKGLKAGTKRLKETEELIQVRVVFHIVYQQEIQNITDEQIFSQLKVLNQDFRKKNPDTVNTPEVFKPLAADCRISFVMASEDEEGAPTNGITRTYTTHGPFGNTDIHYSAKGGKDAWNTEKYLNVWVCSLPPGTLGYGTPPGTSAAHDGVVIHFESFGTTGTARAPYNGGRTLTHEAGHWLGLQHPWGITGGCEGDDGITDTPLQAAAAEGCDPGRISCGSADMVQNFMNLSEDGCLSLFTTGQAAVMRSVLVQERKGVVDHQAYVMAAFEKEKNNAFYVVAEGSQEGLYRLFLPQSAGGLQHWITDLSGKELIQQTTENISLKEGVLIDLSHYPPGVYIIRIATAEKNYSKRILHLL